MQSIPSLYLTSAVNDWLVNSHHPRILHVFDHACNLINEHREVLSIVAPQIRNGPFNLVVEDDVLFSDHLSLQSPVSFSTTQLRLGDLTINTAGARLWNPRPNWEELHSKRETVLHQIHEMAYPNGHESSQTTLLAMTGITNSPVSTLSSALVTIDIPMAKHLASKIAGLGMGLTPSGDDFIVGALHAVWIVHPPEAASVLAHEIASATHPLTTSLSAAWLRSAGKGEAGMLWHDLFNSLLHTSHSLESSVSQILSVGETSGADALTGFIGTLIAYAECEAKPCHS